MFFRHTVTSQGLDDQTGPLAQRNKCNPIARIGVLLLKGSVRQVPDSVQTATLTGVESMGQHKSRACDADFASYLEARQPSLLRTAYLLTGSQHGAEDLVQETMAKLYLSWDRVRRADSIDAYVRRALINEHNSLWRRAWNRKEVASGTIPERTPAPEPAGQGSDPTLWSFIQSLPRKQRAVVVLRYYEELSEAETADLLGISVGTVKSQASRALAALRARAPQSLNPNAHPQAGEER
jgi:RNA polymerase sigma-70 factor (sigma-E family)